MVAVYYFNLGRDAVSPIRCPYDPLRPAAFRWERAKRLCVLGGAIDSRRDDPLTVRVFDYLRAIEDTSWPSRCPAPRFRLLHRVHQVFAEDGEVRWELEARLLAGQGDREVARRLGLSPRFVALYHDVFCTCRDRLGATDWVLATFIGPGPTVGFAPGDLGGIWKWVGYFGGPYPLDAVIATTSTRPRPDHPKETLEAARRFVLAAQVPVFARFTALAAVGRIIAENEQRTEPTRVALVAQTNVATRNIAIPPKSGSRSEQPRPRREMGRPHLCGATAA